MINKLANYSEGDFFLGALLIGGAPLAVYLLGLHFLELCRQLISRYANVELYDPNDISVIIPAILLLAALVTFITVIWLRLRRYLVPWFYIFFEAILGIVLAVIIIGAWATRLAR
ncbi:MAG: hypothetical protein JWQ71_1189 [Pedosphaera sp.]|nr:hypothetical protein [Pedosphaera sp.]